MPSGTSTAHTAAAARRSGRSQRRRYPGSQSRMGSVGGSSRYQRTSRVAMPSSSPPVPVGTGASSAAFYAVEGLTAQPLVTQAPCSRGGTAGSTRMPVSPA